MKKETFLKNPKKKKNCSLLDTKHGKVITPLEIRCKIQNGQQINAKGIEVRNELKYSVQFRIC